MKKKFLLICLIVVALGGCASTPSVAPLTSVEKSWITPQQAVLLAASAAPASVDGTFAMTVLATGAHGDKIYLNSERDYRDQRNLTVVITPQATQELTQRLGESPLVSLQDKAILVRGAAVRTKIYFITLGRATDKYYYQTHVNVTDADQVVVR